MIRQWALPLAVLPLAWSTVAYASAESLTGRDVALALIGIVLGLIGAYVKGMERGLERRLDQLGKDIEKQATKIGSIGETMFRDYQPKSEMSAAMAPLHESIGRVEGAVTSLHKRMDRHLTGRADG